ncbi:MAG: hypothetical protein ABIG39_02135 [Candidatus Micrarchaeota archaeon]
MGLIGELNKPDTFKKGGAVLFALGFLWLFFTSCATFPPMSGSWEEVTFWTPLKFSIMVIGILLWVFGLIYGHTAKPNPPKPKLPPTS